MTQVHDSESGREKEHSEEDEDRQIDGLRRGGEVELSCYDPVYTLLDNYVKNHRNNTRQQPVIHIAHFHHNLIGKSYLLTHS